MGSTPPAAAAAAEQPGPAGTIRPPQGRRAMVSTANDLPGLLRLHRQVFPMEHLHTTATHIQPNMLLIAESIESSCTVFQTES